MDFDFSHIAPVKTAKLSLGSSVRFPSQNPESIVLEVRHAGDGNPEFVSARMKAPPGKDRAANYERQAKLYARHVVIGWENVGMPSEAFTAEKCEALLLSLIKHKRTDVLDYIAIYCATPENFHDPVQSGADLGKG